MVLLAAYGNFLDRIILGLDLNLEDSGPLAPMKIEFETGALHLKPLIPASKSSPTSRSDGTRVVDFAPDSSHISFDELQA